MFNSPNFWSFRVTVKCKAHFINTIIICHSIITSNKIPKIITIFKFINNNQIVCLTITTYRTISNRRSCSMILCTIQFYNTRRTIYSRNSINTYTKNLHLSSQTSRNINLVRTISLLFKLEIESFVIDFTRDITTRINVRMIVW